MEGRLATSSGGAVWSRVANFMHSSTKGNERKDLGLSGEGWSKSSAWWSNAHCLSPDDIGLISNTTGKWVETLLRI